MVHGFTANPSIKIESDATEITDGIAVTIIRPENAVSRVRLRTWNLAAANFIANLNTFDNLKVSLRYGLDAWNKVFDGVIEDVSPVADEANRFVDCLAYGQGRALRNTHCAISYGSESENPTLDTPKEIWDAIVDNHINKDFAGNATGYAITKTYIANLSNPTISFIYNPYRPNIQVINEICQVYAAYRAGLASVHWFVDPSKNLFINTIGAHENVIEWPSFYGGSEAASLLEQGTNIISYGFSKRVHSKQYANKIILATDMRKPGYDYWNENAAVNVLWVNEQGMSFADDAINKIVGANSLKFTATASQLCIAYYPSVAQNWDFTKIGSENNPPKIRFYARRTGNLNHAVSIQLRTTDNLNYFYQNLFNTAGDTHLMPNSGDWYQMDFPLISGTPDGWSSYGSPSWSNIDFIAVYFANQGYAGANDFWLDDLHFTGKIIREAFNSTAIAANYEHQKVVRMNTAVDDTMIAATDTGLAARLAYAELLTAQKIPIVGSIVTYGMVDVLPGQFVHCHGEKQNGTFRIDENFRIKEIQQDFTEYGKLFTTLRVTNDLVNTFAKGPADLASLYRNVLFTDPEAQSLKATGIDPLVPRLSKDYPS